MSWGDWIGLAGLLVTVAGGVLGICHQYLKSIKKDARVARGNSLKTRLMLQGIASQVNGVREDHKKIQEQIFGHRDILAEHGERIATVEAKVEGRPQTIPLHEKGA